MGKFRSNGRGVVSRNGGSTEAETSIVERETEESLTSALHDSDTPAELIADGAGGDHRPTLSRSLLAVVGLFVTVSSVLALKRVRARRRQQTILERVRSIVHLDR